MEFNEIPTVTYDIENNKYHPNQIFEKLFIQDKNENETKYILESIINSIDFSNKESRTTNEITLYGKLYSLLILNAICDNEVLILFFDAQSFYMYNFTNPDCVVKESFYLKLLETIYPDFTIINSKGIIESVMPNFKEVYNIDNEKIIGMSIFEAEERKIFNPCVSALVLRTLKKHVALQKTQSGEYIVCTSIPIFDCNDELDKIISYTKGISSYSEVGSEYNKIQELYKYYSTEIDKIIQEEFENNRQKEIIGISPQIIGLKAMVNKIAKFDANVFISGESGVGKNVFAELIHDLSQRKNNKLISINCGAIPEALLESELFGYEKGAFTGADSNGKAGLIELADGGTLFLDEIGEMPIHMQVKLLKAIQEKKITRIGGIHEKSVDFRLITATNKNIVDMVDTGEFRKDLYYRINVLSIDIPPLRERTEDIFPFINYFLKMYRSKYNIDHTFNNEALYTLEKYSWPGNIRELENTIERIFLTADEYVIDAAQLPCNLKTNDKLYKKPKLEGSLKQIMEEVERDIFISAYEKYKSGIKVAKALGISQPTASIKLRKYLCNEEDVETAV